MKNPLKDATEKTPSETPSIPWKAGDNPDTVGGALARIYATDHGGAFPMVGSVRKSEGVNWLLVAWRVNGECNSGPVGGYLTGLDCYDLVLPKVKWLKTIPEIMAETPCYFDAGGWLRDCDSGKGDEFPINPEMFQYFGKPFEMSCSLSLLGRWSENWFCYKDAITEETK